MTIVRNRLLANFTGIVFLLAFSVAYTTAAVATEENKDGHHTEHKEGDHHKKHGEYGKLTPEQAEILVEKWEDPKRDKWQLPEKVVYELNLKPGQVIADIGSGGGYFAVRMAKAVEKTGKLYAVDVEKNFLQHIEKRIKEEHITNLEFIHAKLDDPMLSPNSLDVIFICNAWHHIGGRDAYIWKLYKALKPGGRLVVIDFRYQQPQIKPVNIDHRIPRSQTMKLAQEGGFKLHGEFFFLPRQYFLIFKKVLLPQD